MLMLNVMVVLKQFYYSFFLANSTSSKLESKVEKSMFSIFPYCDPTIRVRIVGLQYVNVENMHFPTLLVNFAGAAG